MSTKHTPGPYRIVGLATVIGSNGADVAAFMYRHEAEAFVRACNNHDALLTALQNAANMLEYPSDHAIDWHQSAIKCLRAAIAAATK